MQITLARMLLRVADTETGMKCCYPPVLLSWMLSGLHSFSCEHAYFIDFLKDPPSNPGD